MPRGTIVLNGRGMTRASLLNFEKGVKMTGGYSIRDWVPNRRNAQGKLEAHLIFGNYIGPYTHVERRIREGVKPTTVTDAAAKIHDLDYLQIGNLLRRGAITRDEAIRRIRESDKKLIKATYAAPSGPIEQLHAKAARSGMIAKRALEDLKLMNPTKFVSGGNVDLPAQFQDKSKPRKPRKQDLLVGLKKRVKKQVKDQRATSEQINGAKKK